MTSIYVETPVEGRVLGDFLVVDDVQEIVGYRCFISGNENRAYFCACIQHRVKKRVISHSRTVMKMSWKAPD